MREQSEIPLEAEPDRSADVYQDLKTPLMRELHRQVYGEDIRPHSWGTPQAVRHDIARLRIGAASPIADRGRGPCGALIAILADVRLPFDTASFSDLRARGQNRNGLSPYRA